MLFHTYGIGLENWVVKPQISDDVTIYWNQEKLSDVAFIVLFMLQSGLGWVTISIVGACQDWVPGPGLSHQDTFDQVIVNVSETAISLQIVKSSCKQTAPLFNLSLTSVQVLFPAVNITEILAKL